MLDNIYSIIGKNGEVRQGYINWLSHDEFLFSEDSILYSKMWCKTDYWTVVGQGVKIFKLSVI